MKIILNKNRGFTFIEVLLVVALISIITGGIINAVDPLKRIREARDAERLTDMHIITNALEQYHVYYKGSYPSISADSCCDGWDQGPCGSDKTFIQELVEGGFLRQAPTDPKGGSGTGCYGYNYYRYNAGSYGCDPSRGRFYVLGVRDMESSGLPHPDSPGWSCPNRDWQNEFDWVTGGFED